MGTTFTTPLATPGGGESTLLMTRSKLKAALGRYLPINRDPTKWSAKTIDDNDAIIDAGLRMFYYPPILPGENTAWMWSWTKPTLEEPIVADTADYTLPADFGGFIAAKLSWVATDNRRCQVTMTSVNELLKMRQRGSLAGLGNETQYGAVRFLAGDGSGGQRQELLLFPTPTVDGTLTAPYHSYPTGIADDAPYPLGNAPHGETLLEAVLAAAELKMNDEVGPHNAMFMVRLAASVSIDRQLTTPRNFGYNANRTHHRRDLHPCVTVEDYVP